MLAEPSPDESRLPLPDRRAGPLRRVRRDGLVGRAIALAGLVLAASGPVAAQTGVLLGKVDDARAGTGVGEAFVQLTGTRLTAVTDATGRFQIPGIPAGPYTLTVSHIAYGGHTTEIRIAAGETTSVRVLLSDSAIALEPIDVDVLSNAERQARSAGYRRSVVSRAQLALAENTNMTMADVLRSYAPSVRVRSAGNFVGMPVCIELRSVRATFRNDCLSPAVYLDGVPITNPTTLYNNLDVQLIESIEVVPAAEAGARYGSGALFGALLIETLRPGLVSEEGSKAVPGRRSPAFDWSAEPTSHPSARSFLFGFLGNAAGVAIGVSAANNCIGTRAPSNDRIISKCDSGATLASATAALVLPAFGGAVGSWLGGSTQTSKGRLLPGIVGGAMALLPAYGLLFSAERMNSDVLRGFGISLLVVGVPAITTLADHQFRSRRENVPPPPF